MPSKQQETGQAIISINLPPHVNYNPGLPTLDQVMNAYILNVIGFCQGNQTKAAEILGISTRTIRNRLSKIKKQRPA